MVCYNNNILKCLSSNADICMRVNDLTVDQLLYSNKTHTMVPRCQLIQKFYTVFDISNILTSGTTPTQYTHIEHTSI